MTHIIDENVFFLADKPNYYENAACQESFYDECHNNCRFLLETLIVGNQQIALDTEGVILYEKYQKQIQKIPLIGIGREFLIWLMQNEWDETIVEKVDVVNYDLPNTFEAFDSTDQIFMKVALNTTVKPAIIHNATDSDWLFFEKPERLNYLVEQQVSINQLCPECLKAI